MKKIFTLLCCIIAASLTFGAQQNQKITVLHTNDLHSHLQGYGPESDYTPLTTGDDKTIGGFSRIATIIKETKNENDKGTLVVDAGDCMMGTLFHSLEVYTGFQLQIMEKAGYDLIALGNHDFDFGPSKYARIASIAASEGSIPQLILGNAVTEEKDKTDDTFEELYDNKLLSRYSIIERSGVMIGVFSIIGSDADDSAPYAAPVRFSAAIQTSRSLVKELKKKGCDIIICLSHSGVTLDDKGIWTGEDVKLAEKVKGIDLIISGHTHTTLKEPIVVNDIPIVQAGSFGKYVGKAEMTWDGEKAHFDSYKLIEVNDDVAGDPEIQSLIDKQEKKIDKQILHATGLYYSMPVASASYPLTCFEFGDVESSNLGPFVADAIYEYVNTEGPGTDIAMTAAGVLRDPVLPGVQSVADMFRVTSLGSGNDALPGYPLAQVWVTGKELKNITEVLLMASASTPSNFCYYSHMKVTYDPKGGLFNKVKKIELTGLGGDVLQVDVSKKNRRLYSIVANSYMLDFIGIIKQKSFGLINVVPKDKNGRQLEDMKHALVDFNAGEKGIQEGKEWIALINYFKRMKGSDENVIPEFPEYFRSPVPSLVKTGR